MKKILLIGLVLTSVNFFGQDVNSEFNKKPFFGVKAGFNYFNASSGKSYGAKYNGEFGYQLGGILNIPMSKGSSFVPELIFQRITFGYEYFNEYGNGTTQNVIKYNTNVLFLPLNFKCLITDKVDLEFGPSIGLTLNNTKKGVYTTNLNGVLKSEEYEEKISNGGFVFAFNFGSNYSFSKNLYAGLRYSLLINSYSNENSIIKSGLFAVSAGYNFKK